MKPHQSIHFGLQFTAPMSPWWLLLALPLALAAGWYLLRGQHRIVSRRNAIGLLALRLGLLGTLVFLAFRPNVVFRKILTYPGRIVFLVDDSESMTTRDNAMPDEDALRLARQLDPQSAGADVVYPRLAQLLDSAAFKLQLFGAFSRTADRRQDAFWKEAGRVKDELGAIFDEFDGKAGGVPDVRAEARELRASLDVFFTGSEDPGRKACDDFQSRAEAITGRLLDLQAAKDREALAAGNPGLQAQADAIRARTRLDLLRTKLDQLGSLVRTTFPNQWLQVRSLMTGKEATTMEFAGVPGRTDLAGGLQAVLQEENPFPLSGIVVFSDGRDLGGGSVDAVAQAAARQQTVVHAVGVGSVREPVNLAILQVIAPPFAVKGTPVTVKLLVKTSFPKPVQIKVTLSQGGTSLAEQTVAFETPGVQTVTLPFTPANLGLGRYNVRFESRPDEVFPLRNNTQDFALDVRERKIWVLFLDWKPRWETRFALNILQRLDYVELNSIIGLVQEGATVPRGLQKGTWPNSPAALQAYDLVILGDLPPDTLTAAEWTALQDFVTEKGKTLCVLGGAGLPDALQPVVSRTSAALHPALGDLRLTPAGAVHPLTRQLQLTGAPEESCGRLRPESQVLVFDDSSHSPVISCRFAGHGRTVMIDHDQLWRLLHPAQVEAHTDLFMNLVSWSAQGGDGREDVARDLGAYTTGQPVEVWTRKPMRVSAEHDGKEVAAADATLLRPGAALARAVFTDLPAQDVTIGGRPVLVTADDPELKVLARDEAYLQNLATAADGRYVDFSRSESVLPAITPRERVETFERVWRLWDSTLVFTILAVALAVEWVWRKLVGLV